MLMTESQVSVEERATYTSKIDSILATSDLATVSVKKIRQSLQEQTDSDISQHKVSDISEIPL